MRVLICGGRDFNRYDILCKTLDAVHKVTPITTVISGCAKGADTMGENYAEVIKAETLRFPANWKAYGPAAGPIRNQQMLKEGLPDLVVAFPTSTSKGTYDMINRAEKAGVKLIIVKQEGE